VVKASDQLDEAEAVAAPQHELLGEAREVDPGDRRRRHEFEREVAVCDAVERIRGRPVEAERRCRRVAVDRKRGAGERSRAERALVEAFAAIGEAPAVAAEHLDIGHEMVAEGHRLGNLQMRVAGHHGVGVALGLADQRRLQRLHLTVEPVDRAAHPEAHVRCDLIVARSRGVQPAGRRADEFGETHLDIHVNVLVLSPEREPP